MPHFYPFKPALMWMYIYVRGILYFIWFSKSNILCCEGHVAVDSSRLEVWVGWYTFCGYWSGRFEVSRPWQSMKSNVKTPSRNVKLWKPTWGSTRQPKPSRGNKNWFLNIIFVDGVRTGCSFSTMSFGVYSSCLFVNVSLTIYPLSISVAVCPFPVTNQWDNGTACALPHNWWVSIYYNTLSGFRKTNSHSKSFCGPSENYRRNL